LSDQNPDEVVQWAGVTHVGRLRLLAIALLSGVVLLGGSCLNPRPEELPSADPQTPMQPGSIGPNATNPGIGGDDLPPQFGEDIDDAPGNMSNGQTPETQPPVTGVPPEPAADAGLVPGEGIPPPDAGVDGG
jgi:hypothetical protein